LQKHVCCSSVFSDDSEWMWLRLVYKS
jgi:hypothetical protein